jgi:timeless
MKSLKNEFRRDSVRLEDGDRAIFFQIVTFFCKWWRASGGVKLVATKDSSSTSSSIGQLIFTMDVFTFNLVMNATDTFTEHKKYERLAQAVALLSEMMHLLQIMYSSKESTEQIMAMGLMDRLFYGSEPLDRLPKLLSKWTPGMSTREYLCDLVEICHMTLKLLDANAKACKTLTETNLKDDASKHDTVAKMKAIAAEFDVPSYFARKIVSNQTVFMYTQLLSQYAVNAPHVNHRIVAFFLRVCKHPILLGDEANTGACDEYMPKNPLAAKTVTFEPMLYNVQLLTVLNTILNDMVIRKDKEYATLLQFASTIVYNFAAATQANPMLFVEALFKHPLPHRFCDSVTNMYVTDDLRMMAERDMLLQQQRRLEQEAAAFRNDEEESEDEELEFTDAPATSKTTAAADIAEKSAGASDDKGANELDEQQKEKEINDQALEDSDEDDDQIGKRLKRMAEKSAKRTQDLQKRLRELDDDTSNSAASSSDDEDIVENRDSELSAVGKPSETKKARFSFSDSEDDC